MLFAAMRRVRRVIIPKMQKEDPIQKFYRIEDNDLNNIGIDYFSIYEPNLIIGYKSIENSNSFGSSGDHKNNTDYKFISVDISKGWKDASTELIEKAINAITNDPKVISKLQTHLGKFISDNIDLVTKIVYNSNNNTNSNGKGGGGRKQQKQKHGVSIQVDPITTEPIHKSPIRIVPIEAPDNERLRALDDDYFEYFMELVGKEVKEDHILARQSGYTLLSTYGETPINLGVIAPTSAGKTHTVNHTAKYGPADNRKEIRKVGSMSPKTLIREKGVLVDKELRPIERQARQLKIRLSEAKRNNDFITLEDAQTQLEKLLEDSAYIIDLRNTTLLFFEPPHPDLWNIIKSILSHDDPLIEHPFVDKTSYAGMEVKRVFTLGAPACVFCSAKDESKLEGWAEVESRFMIASPNMIQTKYKAGNKLIGQKRGLPGKLKNLVIISPKEIEIGRQCFAYLKYRIQSITSKTEGPVWVPFHDVLTDVLPANTGVDNRAADRLFAMLNIITLTKSHKRAKLVYDEDVKAGTGQEYFIATLEDLSEALALMQNVTGLPLHKLKFYRDYIIQPFVAGGSYKAITSRQIVDYYNNHKPEGTNKLSTDNLTRTYLYELINHGYVQSEEDESTKKKVYLYTPLVDVPPVNLNDHKPENSNDNNKDEDKERMTNLTNLGKFVHNLHCEPILAPKNYKGVPDNWLEMAISTLNSCRIQTGNYKFLDTEGNEIDPDSFIQAYESKVKLHDFVRVPTGIDKPKQSKIESSITGQENNNVGNTTNSGGTDKSLTNFVKFDQFDKNDNKMNEKEVDDDSWLNNLPSKYDSDYGEG
jgi:hypothetical protein